MSAIRLLTLAGRNGPIILFSGMLIGILLPPLTDYAKPFMGLAVFLFTLGAFLKVDRPSFRLELMSPVATALALVWITFGVPLVAFGAAWACPISNDLRLGLLLGTLAPPLGSAAASAAMLGLSAPFALLARSSPRSPRHSTCLFWPRSWPTCTWICTQSTLPAS